MTSSIKLIIVTFFLCERAFGLYIVSGKYKYKNSTGFSIVFDLDTFSSSYFNRQKLKTEIFAEAINNITLIRKMDAVGIVDEKNEMRN